EYEGINEYAYIERDGIRRSCKVFKEGGRTFIPSLSREVKPPSSARLIKEADLCLTSATTTVFLDFSARGSNLGRVYFRVLCDTCHGRQFVMLALKTNGPTFKGATFCRRSTSHIALQDYLTEKGRRSNEPLLTIKEEKRGTGSKGKLFKHGKYRHTASFTIVTKTLNDSYCPGYFGDVVAGMNVIDTAASSEYDIKEIMITQCGIVLEK
ncbi:unnamed protein product, partial [Meganyctiphanes norvegica]